MSTVVVVIGSVPPRLYGQLMIWLLEVRAGVYVGDTSRRIQEMIWRQITRLAGCGNMVMAWVANAEPGFGFQIRGENRCTPVGLDGLHLVSFLPVDNQQVRHSSKIRKYFSLVGGLLMRSKSAQKQLCMLNVFPAPMGISRVILTCKPNGLRVPRASGDKSVIPLALFRTGRCSSRQQGQADVFELGDIEPGVFSALAGVNRTL